MPGDSPASVPAPVAPPVQPPSDGPTLTVRKPDLEPAAENAVAEIERDTGKRCPPWAVVWLQDAASRMVRPDRESPKLIDLPTECGGALLWPLSYFAANWLDTIADPIFGPDFRVRGYVMAHAHDDSLPAPSTIGWRWLRRLVTRRSIGRAVDAWLLTLKCGPAALAAAVDSVLGRGAMVRIPNLAPAPGAPAVSASDWGDTIALLCERYHGTTPTYWTCEVSIAVCDERLTRACRGLPEDKRPSFDDTAEFICLTAYIKAEILKT